MSQDESRNTATPGYAPLGYPLAQPPQSPPPVPGYASYPYAPGGAAGLPPPQGTAYYASAHLPTEPPPRELTRGHSRARLALIFLVLFVFGSLTLGIFGWMIFRNSGPLFEIKAFSVPYLNVTNDHTTLEAKWEANITVINPSRKMDVFLGEIEGSLIYRGLVLDIDAVDPLNIGVNSEGVLRAKFSVPELASVKNASATPGPLVARPMEDDRKSGVAEFDLKLIMEATFTAENTLWIKRSVLRVLCREIKVNFPSPAEGGSWYGVRKECLTYA